MRNPAPIGTPGRPQALQQIHKDYIEARTLQNRKLTNKSLADEMLIAFPELNQIGRAHV
jgi:hypothetical protein